MKRHSATVATAVTALLALACGGGSDGPSGPQDDPPTVVGSYAVDHAFSLRQGPATGTFAECTGSLDVTNQTAGSFNGSVSVAAEGDCGAFGGDGSVTGTVTPAGAVSLTVSGIALDELLEIVGCVSAGATPPFEGTFSGGRLTVEQTRPFDCTDPDTGMVSRVDVIWEIAAVRGSGA